MTDTTEFNNSEKALWNRRADLAAERPADEDERVKEHEAFKAILAAVPDSVRTIVFCDVVDQALRRLTRRSESIGE